MNQNIKLGRNDRCWCGSGKKYKRCHLDRASQQPLPTQEVLKSYQKTFNKGYCLHPQASPEACKGNIVEAHTIQRNGGLSRIARGGHVYNCLMHHRSSHTDQKPNLVGIKQASTFTGFCSYHDDSFFAPIEKKPFVGSSQQVALLSHRAIARELFLKKAVSSQAPTQRELDRGLTPHAQMEHQTNVSYYQSGVTKAIEELEEVKGLHDRILMSNDFRNLNYYVVSFEGNPELLCSAITQSTHDFSGNLIQELGNLDQPAQWLHFSLIATDSGGAAVFSWLRQHKASEELINTLHELPDDKLPHAIVRFTFEFFGNTYFSPDWWDKLNRPTRLNLMERQMRERPPDSEPPRPDDCLRDDGIRAVQWKVQSRLRN